jgi:hypothetical protein
MNEGDQSPAPIVGLDPDSGLIYDVNRQTTYSDLYGYIDKTPPSPYENASWNNTNIHSFELVEIYFPTWVVNNNDANQSFSGSMYGYLNNVDSKLYYSQFGPSDPHIPNDVQSYIRNNKLLVLVKKGQFNTAPYTKLNRELIFTNSRLPETWSGWDPTSGSDGEASLSQVPIIEKYFQPYLFNQHCQTIINNNKFLFPNYNNSGYAHDLMITPYNTNFKRRYEVVQLLHNSAAGVDETTLTIQPTAWFTVHSFLNEFTGDSVNGTFIAHGNHTESYFLIINNVNTELTLTFLDTLKLCIFGPSSSDNHQKHIASTYIECIMPTDYKTVYLKPGECIEVSIYYSVDRIDNIPNVGTCISKDYYNGGLNQVMFQGTGSNYGYYADNQNTLVCAGSAGSNATWVNGQIAVMTISPILT